VVYVRVMGLGNMSNAPVLKVFSEKMIEEGFRRYIIDLESCRGIDSTFMGTLLDIATSAREGDRPTKKPTDSDPGELGVLLVNVDDHCRKQLSSVGLDAFLPIAAERDGAFEVLVPLAAEFCIHIDVKAKRIDVSLPEGLRDLNRG